ncbi:MAG: hypothetical protein F4X11_25915 [Acidobacteria bacterium]|nr:hypothetical protein [Acidobacteriota bacterium]MYN68414.1 hypothetical protein [Acidobacteriota bacterium]
MRPAIAALAVFGVLATAGAVPAVGQQDRWQVRDLEGGGKEFQLPNDEGAVIILACRLQGMGAGFEFVEPIEPTQRAMVRGIPGARENIVVEPVNPYTVQVAGGRSLDFTLAMLRSASSIYVRASGEAASFAVFGSATIVEQCVEQMEDRTAGMSRSNEQPALVTFGNRDPQ